MDFFDPQTVWLNLMNLALGLLTLFLFSVIAGSILLDLRNTTEAKTHKA